MSRLTGSMFQEYQEQIPVGELVMGFVKQRKTMAV